MRPKQACKSTRGSTTQALGGRPLAAPRALLLLLLGVTLAFTAPATAQPAGEPAAAAGSGGAPEISAGDGTLYLAAFPSRILVIDEATASVVDEIAVPHGPPRALVASADRSRFHFVDTTFEHMTTVDVAARAVTDSFTLSEGNRKVRIRSFRVAPDGATAILHVDAAVKLIDRYEVEPYRLLEVDLATHEVLRELPWPTGAASFGSRMLFSPDGQYLYFFDREDILILEADTFDELDRWSLREPIEPGMGRMQFSFDDDLLYEEPGFFTNLFTVHDDAQDRDLMGVARIDLPNREVVDFYTLGPSRPIQFALAPGRRTAYGLSSSIDHYEFWTFHLDERRIGDRRRIEGRPRMALDVSTNGEVLYISSAGNTIDYYDADSFDYLHTLTLDGDMTSGLVVMPAAP